MFIPVFGTPTALTAWAVNMATIICRLCAPECVFIAEATVEGLRMKWPKRKGGSVVVHSDCPEPRLVTLFNSISAPFILVIENADVVANYVRIERNLDWVQAIRFTTQSYCSLLEFHQRPECLLLSEIDLDRSVRDVLEDVITHFSFSITADKFDEILNSILQNQDEKTKLNESTAYYFKNFLKAINLRSEIPQFIRLLAKQYNSLFGPHEMDVIEWPVEVFHVFDGDIRYANGPVEMVGRARVLYGGHILHLPSGRWVAELCVRVLENISGNMLHSDVLVEDRFVDGIIGLVPPEGSVTFTMTFENSNPSYPIHFRVAIMQGAIEGILLLEHVRFFREHQE